MKTAEQIAQAALNAVERKFVKELKEDYAPETPPGFRSLSDWAAILGYNREYTRKVMKDKVEAGGAEQVILLGRKNGTNAKFPFYKITK